MDRHANYVLVGIFVSVMLIAGAVFTIWVAESYDKKAINHYTIYFAGDVNGLSIGGIVRYKGVEVGKVVDIRLAKKRTDLVKADIEVVENTPVRLRTQAVLKPLGITGLSFIVLETDNTDMEPAANIDGEPYPVIHAGESDLERVFKDIPQVSQNLLETIGRLNAVLSAENIEGVSETITNIKTLTKNLADVLNVENTEKVSQTLSNVSLASGELEDMLQQFGSVADDIEKAAKALESILSGNKRQFERFSNEGLDQLMLLIKDSRKMVDAVRKLSVRLEEDPSVIIYQPNYEGVKVKK